MKKTIITLLLGILIGTTLTVGASYAFNASDIDFTPSDSSWNVSNVSDAIKDLKNTEDNIVKLNVGDTYFNTYEGDLLTNNDITLDLNKGKYLVYIQLEFGYYAESMRNYNENLYVSYINMSCTNNCTYKVNNGWDSIATGSEKLYNNYYLFSFLDTKIYYVDAPNDTKLTMNQIWPSKYSIGTVLSISATKIAD